MPVKEALGSADALIVGTAPMPPAGPTGATHHPLGAGAGRGRQPRAQPAAHGAMAGRGKGPARVLSGPPRA